KLSHVDRRPWRRRKQERPQRLAVPFPLERPAERQIARKQDRDPQDAGSGAFNRSTLLDERKFENQHARNREEEGRVQNLAALQFDGEVLSQHERGDFGKRHAPPTVERYRRRRSELPGSSETSRPSRTIAIRVASPSAISRSWVARMKIAPTPAKCLGP